MIPRLIHQFWHGPPVPDDVQRRMAEWPAHNPSWRYLLWDDSAVSALIDEALGPDLGRYFRAAQLPVMRSDIGRIAILRCRGGVFIDDELGCAGSIDELADGTGFVLMRPSERPGVYNPTNAFLGGEAGAVLFDKAWEAILGNMRTNLYSLDVRRITGPDMLASVWHRNMSDAQRAAYRGISMDDMPRYADLSTYLDPHRGASHWSAEIKRRQIVSFRRADAVMKRRALREAKAKETAAGDGGRQP